MTTPSDAVDVLLVTSAHTHLALAPQVVWSLVERAATLSALPTTEHPAHPRKDPP
jgi:hypothetical protein